MSQSLEFNYILTKTYYVFQFYMTEGMFYSLVVENHMYLSCNPHKISMKS